MDLLIFGTGGYYQYWQYKLQKHMKEDRILAFIDNNAKNKREYEGKSVYFPQEIGNINYDAIVLMSNYAIDMHKQLREQGVLEEKIYFFDEYVRHKSHGKVRFFVGGKCETKQRILFLMDALGYNGGTMAMVNAARAMKRKGYDVAIGAAWADEDFLDEIVREGLNVIIAPAIPAIGVEEWFWLRFFDVVLVNVFQMVQAACEISKKMPVIWWLHESTVVYPPIQYKFRKYCNPELMKSAYIIAVSEVAKNNFEQFYPGLVRGVLPYGLPDKKINTNRKIRTDKFVFAVIGTIIPLKAQDLFLQAASVIPNSLRAQMEFWIIGEEVDDKFLQVVQHLLNGVPQARMWGGKTRAELDEMFSDIDVVVCTSKQECLSTVIVEGMMYRKLVMVNERNGVTKYILDNKNGFLYNWGDATDLAEKMAWIYLNRESLEEVRENARKTYEDNFTLEKFADELEHIIINIERT